MDQHNEYGLFFTPRFLMKYNFTENTIGRASFGTGWRTVNLFSEKEIIRILAGNDFQKKWYLVNLARWHLMRVAN